MNFKKTKVEVVKTKNPFPNLKVSSISDINPKIYQLEDISTKIIDSMNKILGSKIKLNIKKYND